ncbi:hypothetical protein JI739_04260 [Ramlibacter sp. AW1]|uniref:Asparagine synthetase domain-containing protein n=1 Tax=Ramlibacter aurantiacus TaxID=2801330 RepID=A0A937D3P8_9BURK|nr:hypothetical protein [Ramlibacter aurantiacus]MBL0419557.1 hypothetical protein [Ramlibacter aurantiacus]
MDVPHTRQFVFGPAPYAARSDWVTVRVGQLWLSHCPSLCVHRSVNVNGEDVMLLGVPIQCADGATPEQELARMSVDTMKRLTDTWSNRWAVISGSRIATDAGALLAVFYPSDTHEHFYASSSQRLLGQLFPGCDENVRGSAFAPATPQRGVFALLPGQWLDVATGTVEEIREPLFDQVPGSIEDLREEYAALLRNCFKRIHQREQKTLFISLSGGADSRRNVAAASSAGVPFEAFTFRKRYWDASDADLQLPTRIGRLLGFPVHTVDARVDPPSSVERRDIYMQHTAFRALDIPGELYYYYIRDMWKGYNSAQIDGQAYEMTSHYYHKKVEPFAGADAMLAWCFSSTALSRAASKRYLSAAAGGSMVDLRDFVCLLANNAVCAQMNQAMDMWAVLYTPANCRRMYSLSQSAPVEQRTDKRFLISVTELLQPSLASLPTNPPDALPKRMIQNARKLIQVARKGGIAGLRTVARRKLLTK